MVRCPDKREDPMADRTMLRPHKDRIVIFRRDAEWTFELHSDTEAEGEVFHNKATDRADTLDELLEKVSQRYA